MTVCKESGFRNTPKCTAVDTVLAHRNALRSPSCHFYEIILTDEKERYRYHRGCSGNKKLHSRSRFVLPPLQAYFYKKNHADYQSLPPYHPDCVNYTTEATFTIVYPKHKSEIIGTVDLDGSQQPIVFEATHANSDATLFWHVDNHYLGETTGKHTIQYIPEPGEHLLTVLDDEGVQKKILFTVLDE